MYLRCATFISNEDSPRFQTDNKICQTGHRRYLQQNPDEKQEMLRPIEKLKRCHLVTVFRI